MCPLCWAYQGILVPRHKERQWIHCVEDHLAKGICRWVLIDHSRKRLNFHPTSFVEDVISHKMSSCHHHIPISDQKRRDQRNVHTISLTAYNLLKDSWSVLDQALPLSDEVYRVIKDANNGAIINNWTSYSWSILHPYKLTRTPHYSEGAGWATCRVSL